MKKKTKIILLITIGVLVISNFLNVSFVKTNYTVSISSFSKPTSGKLKTKKTFNTPYQIVFHGLNDFSRSKNNSTNHNINVYVEEKSSMGIFRFMPIYKPISINSKVIYKWNNPSKVSSNPIGVLESEEFEMSGHMNIFGICSVKDAKEKTQTMIYTSIKNQIKRNIKNKLNDNQKN
jgi:hypothetical protein